MIRIIHFTGLHPQNGSIHMPEVYGEVTMTLLKEEREYAARLLVFTKATRLDMSGARFQTVMDMPWEEIEKELAYMAGTIPSSWEFVDITFLLTEVSRAAAQQITRTRFTPMDADIFGSYAMQSMRVGEIEPTFYINPELSAIDENRRFIEECHEEQLDQYKDAIARGIKPEDARGLLPLDTHCNLVVKYNLRQLVDMLRTREGSLRVQNEYGHIAGQMRRAVHEIWPWADIFFEPKDKKAIDMIEEVARSLKDAPGLDADRKAHGELATKLAKAADLLKK